MVNLIQKKKKEYLLKKTPDSPCHCFPVPRFHQAESRANPLLAFLYSFYYPQINLKTLKDVELCLQKYLYLSVLGLPFWMWTFLSFSNQRLLSNCNERLLIGVASLVVKHGLQGVQVSVVVSYGTQLPHVEGGNRQNRLHLGNRTTSWAGLWTLSYMPSIYGSDIPTGKSEPPDGRAPGLIPRLCIA